MGDSIVFTVVMGVVALLMAVLYAYSKFVVTPRSMREKQQLAQSLAQLFGVSATTFRVGELPDEVTGVETSVDGVRVQLFPSLGAKGAKLIMVRVLEDKPLPFFTIRKETWRDRLGKLLFLNKEVQTGDADFDREFYIETNEKTEHVLKVLQDQTARETLRSFAQRHFIATVASGGLGTSVFAKDLNEALRDEIQNKVTELASVLKNLPPSPGCIGKHVPQPGEKFVLALWIGWVSLYLLYVLTYVYIPHMGLSTNPHAEKDLMRFGVLGFFLFVPVFFFYVRGHSGALRVFTLSLFPAFFIGLTGGPTVAFPINALLDSGTATEIKGAVLEKKYTGGKFSRHMVKLDVGNSDTFTVTVSSSQYRNAKKGDIGHVFVKPGFFHWRWVERVEIETSSPGTTGQAAASSSSSGATPVGATSGGN